MKLKGLFWMTIDLSAVADELNGTSLAINGEQVFPDGQLRPLAEGDRVVLEIPSGTLSAVVTNTSCSGGVLEGTWEGAFWGLYTGQSGCARFGQRYYSEAVLETSIADDIRTWNDLVAVRQVARYAERDMHPTPDKEQLDRLRDAWAFIKAQRSRSSSMDRLGREKLAELQAGTDARQ